MNWIALFFELELGWMPQGDFVMYSSEPFLTWYPVSYTAYTELQAEVIMFDTLFAGGCIRTSVWQLQESGYTFFPHKAVYTFYAGARWGLLEVGWRHFCIHPVVPFFALIQPEAIWEGAYDELYIRFSGRIN